jgi:HK97 family phage major capsid protein
MRSIKQIRQDVADNARAQAALKTEGRTLLAIAADKRTPEQETRITAIEQEMDVKAQDAATLATELSRAERFAADERAQGTVDVQAGHDNREDAPWGPTPPATASPLAQTEARHMALGAFAQAVRAAAYGSIDPRLHAAATGAGTQVDSNLGFAVPQEVAPGIEREMYDTGEILSRVDARTISVGNSIAYNVLDETSRGDGSRGGGILGYWVDEGTAPTASNTKLARMELKLRKVGAFWVMTDELLSDAVALGGELESAVADELIFQTENKIWRGNGASAPLGFLNAPCLVTVAKETNQPAATINTTNLAKMWGRMPSRSKRNAVWMYNAETGPALMEMAQIIGTGGTAPRFVNYSTDGGMTIFGRPAIEVEYAEAAGTVGDIALVDWKKYRLIRKGGIEQASSMHVYFSTGEQAFRAFYRVDGQPAPRSAITPFKGTATLSPFVVLATRA